MRLCSAIPVANATRLWAATIVILAITKRISAMSKPKLLDLFCGAGGCSVGYARAGFEVRGIDIAPHKDYPFEIKIADAMDFDSFRDWIDWADVIHASPPCPRYSRMTAVSGNRDNHPDLIEPLIKLLNKIGKPYVIENVPGAPIDNPLILCGSSFGLRVRRHRLFYSNRALLGLPCDHKSQGRAIGVYGNQTGSYEYQLARYARIGRDYGIRASSVADAQDALGIDWMSKWDDLTDSIPPAYTEFIGKQLC